MHLSTSPGSDNVPSLTPLARAFVGAYARMEDAFLDFEHASLCVDGTYIAEVDAKLVNPSVRSFGARCTLPERGAWNAFAVDGKIRLRVRPTTSCARVYGAALSDAGSLVLDRRGSSTVLRRASVARQS